MTAKFSAAVLAFVILALVMSAQTIPATNLIEYPLPGTVGTGATISPLPEDIVVLPSRTQAWFTESSVFQGNKIGVLDYSSNTFTEYGIPTVAAQARQIANVTTTTLSYIVFSEFGKDKIGVLNLTAAPPVFLEYSLQAFSSPLGVAGFSNSTGEYAVFTEFGRNKIGIINLRQSPAKIMEFSIPTPNSNPAGVAVDSNNFIWFTESAGGAGKIGKLNPATGRILEFQIPDPAYYSQVNLREIAIDQFDNVWFTNNNTAAGRIGIGRLEPFQGRFTFYYGPTSLGRPLGIATSKADNSVWFTTDQNNIVKLSPLSLVFQTYGLSSGSLPMGIHVPVVGGVAEVWFTEFQGNKIGRFTNIGAHPSFNETTTLTSTATASTTTSTTFTSRLTASTTATTFSTASPTLTTSSAVVPSSTILTDTIQLLVTSTTTSVTSTFTSTSIFASLTFATSSVTVSTSTVTSVVSTGTTMTLTSFATATQTATAQATSTTFLATTTTTATITSFAFALSTFTSSFIVRVTTGLGPLPGPQVPGFPFESIAAGLLIGLVALLLVRRRRHNDRR